MVGEEAEEVEDDAAVDSRNAAAGSDKASAAALIEMGTASNDSAEVGDSGAKDCGDKGAEGRTSKLEPENRDRI